MIHMAETAQRSDGTYYWFCRCGQAAFKFTDQQAARKDGDAHLAQANADA